jgi:hypothetical protein
MSHHWGDREEPAFAGPTDILVRGSTHWTGRSNALAKRRGMQSHANPRPPHVLKSLDRDIMLFERVADLARRQLKYARGLGLHPPSRLHRFEQTFPLSMPISMQDIARV